MRGLLLAGVIVVAAALTAAAQPQTIGQHFRAYNAALESGDLATAEREAAAALQLSESQDGDGGHTAVLALNLATTRLSAGHGADALAPAQRALRLARANSDSGVDARLATLVEAHAALMSPGEMAARDAAQRLIAALSDPQLHGFDADAYSAAADLGAWHFSHEHYREARQAWLVAGNFSTGSPFGGDVGRAYANVGVASAIVMYALRHPLMADDAQVARGALDSALAALRPHLTAVPAGAPIPGGLREYALADAWYMMLWQQMSARNLHPERVARDDPTEPPNLPDGDARPPCKRTPVMIPPIHFPMVQNDAQNMGAVIVLIQTDDAGAVTRYEVLATVGAGFAGPTNVMRQWRYQRAPDAEPGCRLAMQTVVRVNYAP